MSCAFNGPEGAFGVSSESEAGREGGNHIAVLILWQRIILKVKVCFG